MTKKCSIISEKNGRKLYGTAALLHEMSKQNGPDAYMAKIAAIGAYNALNMSSKKKPKPKPKK